jgi:hypothetical protein
MYIIYPNKYKSLCLISPADNTHMSIQDIALKDTPFGLPFLIINDSDLPYNFDFFMAWEADFSNPHGHGLGAHRYFIEKAKEEISQNINVQENRDLIKRMKKELLETEGVVL